MRPSISRRLVLWLAVPLLLLALCGALVHYFTNVAPGVITSDRRLKDAANALMAHVQIKNGEATLDATSHMPPRLPVAESMIYALRNSQGRLLAGDPRIPAVAMSGETSQLIAIIPIDHRNLRSLTTRFDTPAGMLLITVADISRAAEPTARFGLMSTLLWDFVQLDITLVLMWVGIQLGLRPVKKLRDEIAARSPQDLRPIDEASVPREIAPIAVTLNRLFGTLRASVQSQQRFIANTAHQLRTPISGLQAQLELLIAEPAAAPVKHRLMTLEEGIKQLAHSANQLLALARADPTVNITTKKQSVRLDTTVADVATRYFDRALRSNIDLGVDLKPVSILGDSSLLDDLLSNLVDNSLKYTPAGGTVTISVGIDQGKPYLAVEDTGIGIPESEFQRVRQRFYRIPNSPGHGSGLGLAIVEEIARIHDATFELGPGTTGRGTRVMLKFS